MDPSKRRKVGSKQMEFVSIEKARTLQKEAFEHHEEIASIR